MTKGSGRGTTVRSVSRTRFYQLRIALLSGISLFAVAAHAQDATWTGASSGEWLDNTNWTPATIPTGTAFFDTSATTNVANDAGLVTIGAISFLTTASAYTIDVNNTMIVNGGGVTNSSTVNGQIFNIADTLIFQNSATANAGVGSVTYNNNGFIYFQNTSNAGNSGTTFNNNSILEFFDSATGGAAHITNNAVMDFFNSSSAASATITNATTGTLTFNDSATAGSAVIDNSGSLQFNNSSTAGSATITNSSGGTIDFNTSASAGASSLTNNSGGTVTFHDNSSGGSGATLTNHGTWAFNDSSSLGSSSLSNDGTVDFNNSSNAGTASASITNNNVLNFNNSANAGSAIITNNATLNFNNLSSANSAQITNGSSLFFNNVASAGSATITNNGTLTFNNSASAASATIANNGTLTFNNSTSGGSATITTNSGAVVFFNDNSTAGSAQLITNGTGIVDFSGTSGPLGDNNVSAGSIAGAGTYFLGANMLTVGSNDLSTTVSGALSDGGTSGGTGGGLTKVGGGTLILSGTNSYTGATNVNGGTLQVDGTIATSSLTTVNNGGILTGTGFVGSTTVASGGIFMPGNGTPGSSMTVSGNLNFAAGSSYYVSLNPATSSFTTVTGNATATGAGATVHAFFAAGSYISKQYTIVTAASVQSGMFAGVVNSNLPYGFADSLSYDATHAYLDLTLVFAPPSGGSFNTNQQNVANAIINSFNTVGGIPIVFSGLTPDQLSQLSGELGASFPQVAFQAGNSFLNLMLNPFIGGRFGAAGFGPMGYAAEPKTKLPAAEAAFASALPMKAPASFDARYSIWGSAFGGGGSISGNATVGSQDTNAQVYGFAAGMDYKLTPDALLGFALAGGGTHWSLDQGLGSGRSDMFQAGVYGMTRWGAAYLSAAGAYSFHDVTTDRTVTIAGTDQLEAKFHANVLSGRLEGGYRIAMPWLGVTPYSAVQVQSIALPSYGEVATSGAGTFALNYASHTVTTTRTELGLRFDKSYRVDQGALLTFYSRAAWAHDFNTERSASAIFQALPASNFTVYAAEPAADGALVTAGAEYKMTNGWSIAAKFDGEFSRTTSLYAGAGEIRKAW